MRYIPLKVSKKAFFEGLTELVTIKSRGIKLIEHNKESNSLIAVLRQGKSAAVQAYNLF